jgi:hypothetical protein
VRNYLQSHYLLLVVSPIHPQLVESPNWWDHLSTVCPNSLSLNWAITKHYPECGTRILNTEWNLSWCCFNSQFPTLQWHPYPPNIDALLSDGRASDISQQLVNLFCFSTIGVHSSFQNLLSPSNLVVCRRWFDQMLYIQRSQHQLWLFLDASENRPTTTAHIAVGSSIVQLIEQTTLHSNPSINMFHLLCDQPPGVPYALELKNQPSTCTKIAAVIQANTMPNTSSRSMPVWLNHPTPHEGDLVNILCIHYKPVQYPLPWLHASVGW